MNEYMLIYRGGNKDWMTDTSPEDMAEAMEKWGQWMAELEERKQLVSGGSPLNYEGKRLTGDGVVTDVSLAEIKELVTGYSIVRSETMEDAIEIAKKCPIFLHPNITVEIREIANID
ncbi:YciI family protein [Aliiglaciecola sp. 3_MG-2023]|uniref:YciI family protein n=1 Tax=Aliiglaciecola sp. 3_MG-2023 TaxID=3062644 RepID=UPI0026E1F754|nr:YciI family protein [Aliiglaciecola sp. 3_MG-2023]MDO6694784.1 YciI family protein [Aliiglaciecola sp. 3_MG-2023]